MPGWRSITKNIRSFGSVSIRRTQESPASPGRKLWDGALCFGWIDGVRKSLNETSYVIRFTPRRPRSVWSAVNIREPVRDLRLRATERREDRRRVRKNFSRKQKGLEILPGPTAVVSEDRKLVGNQREEGRNATETARPAPRRLRAGTNHPRTPPAGRKEMTRRGSGL